jgi:hypothetical protein
VSYTPQVAESLDVFVQLPVESDSGGSDRIKTPGTSRGVSPGQSRIVSDDDHIIRPPRHRKPIGAIPLTPSNIGGTPADKFDHYTRTPQRSKGKKRAPLPRSESDSSSDGIIGTRHPTQPPNDQAAHQGQHTLELYTLASHLGLSVHNRSSSATPRSFPSNRDFLATDAGVTLRKPKEVDGYRFGSGSTKPWSLDRAVSASR